MIKNDYISFELDRDTATGIARATQTYIPIEEFKSAFNKMRDLVIEEHLDSLIFDKSKLEIFHQPSMEWYYTTWKKQLVENGLTRHYKILPQLPWFKVSVDAGKQDIRKNNPEFDFSIFSVTYVNSIEEAFEIEKKIRKQ